MADNADKRTVMTDALETLGTKNPGLRDAIHLAVEPVTANEDMAPGQHVRLNVSTGVAHPVDRGHPEAVGIVDPFLPSWVYAGERFWLIVYPRQIKSLRHVWEHPMFAPSHGLGAPSRDLPQPAPKAEAPAAPVNYLAMESERWLRDFCSWADSPGYEAVMAAATEHARSGGAYSDEYLHFSGRDAHGELPKEFWDHFEIVTGIKIHVDRRALYFSCSC